MEVSEGNNRSSKSSQYHLGYDSHGKGNHNDDDDDDDDDDEDYDHEESGDDEDLFKYSVPMAASAQEELQIARSRSPAYSHPQPESSTPTEQASQHPVASSHPPPHSQVAAPENYASADRHCSATTAAMQQLPGTATSLSSNTSGLPHRSSRGIAHSPSTNINNSSIRQGRRRTPTSTSSHSLSSRTAPHSHRPFQPRYPHPPL